MVVVVVEMEGKGRTSGGRGGRKWPPLPWQDLEGNDNELLFVLLSCSFRAFVYGNTLGGLLVGE